MPKRDVLNVVILIVVIANALEVNYQLSIINYEIENKLCR